MQKDFVNENNPKFRLFAEQLGLTPEYVNDDVVDTSSLHKSAFADPQARLHPCHDKSATWRSALHFLGTNQDDQSTLDNLVKMASLHDIKEDVEQLIDVFTSQVKEASAYVEEKFDDNTEDEQMEKFALSVDYAGLDGREVENYFPIYTPELVESSIQDLVNANAERRIPISMLYKASKAIVKAASVFGIEELPNSIRKLGTPRLPALTGHSIIATMRKSAGYNVEPYKELIAEYSPKINEALSVTDSIEAAEEFAEKVASLDIANKVRYNLYVDDPYVSIFSNNTLEDFEKSAANHVSICNVSVPVVELVNLKDCVIDRAFDKQDSKHIKEARNLVDGDTTLNKTASAEVIINELSPGSEARLLKILATQVGW